jgi:D-alanyl-D-alanine carboxypeptidase (penicillin-binding protein 5/6)
MTAQVKPLVVLTLLASALALAGPQARASAEDQVVRTVQTQTVTVKHPQLPQGIVSKTAIAFDAQTGRTLWGRGINERRLIASTTKIMTALVAIEKSRPNQLLTATNYHGDAAESLMGLKPGERLTAQDLIRGLLVVSGNDAADTLAARTMSSRGAFVAEMNRRARVMKLSHTHFSNPVGLDSASNYSTARDLARLTRQALKVQRFRSVVSRRHVTTRSGAKKRKLENSNPLLFKYKWATGVKTGHTLAAGYLLVGSGKKADATVISVVTGAPSEAARAKDSGRILNYARSFYSTRAPLRKNSTLTTLPVSYQDNGAAVRPTRTVAVAARDGQRVTVRVRSAKELKGPLAAGTRVGTAQVFVSGRQVATSAVVLRSGIAAPPVQAVMLQALGRVLPWLLLLLVVGLVVAFLRRPDRKRTGRARYVG